MPCPFFEPLAVASKTNHSFGFGRLPLVDEYDGVCHLRDPKAVFDPAVRFGGCNTGHANSPCSDLNRSVLSGDRRLRFSVAAISPEMLAVTVIEEAGHAPVRWHNIRFERSSETFYPELEGSCQHAQLLAFCRSYLARFHPSQS